MPGPTTEQGTYAIPTDERSVGVLVESTLTQTGQPITPEELARTSVLGAYPDVVLPLGESAERVTASAVEIVPEVITLYKTGRDITALRNEALRKAA